MFNYQTSFVEYKDRVKLLRQSILELSEKTNDRYKNEALENILLVLAAENPKLTQRVLENIHNYVFWNQELIEDVWNQDIEATDVVVAKLQQESGKNTIK
jgi:predicted metalloenzyme YecM